jgi:hypothetical protein
VDANIGATAVPNSTNGGNQPKKSIYIGGSLGDL